MIVTLRRMPQVSPFKSLHPSRMVFGQEFCRSIQVSGKNRLMGEINVGHVFIQLRFDAQ